MKHIIIVALLTFSSLTFTTPALADINNFSISNFAIDYYLDQDAEGRSTLQVIENITADFPTYRQNKGLVREIPRYFDNRLVPFSFVSLQRNNSPEPIYAKYKQGDFHIIETGTDDYMLGPQTYTFTYTLRDVTKYFAETDRDEFYWNTNGTGWRVPIDQLTVQLHIADKLLPLLTDNNFCYQGKAGATTTCLVTKTADGFMAQATGLQAYENLTLAIGFQPHTFTPYPLSLWEIIMPYYKLIFAFSTLIGFIFLIWSLVFLKNQSYREKEIGTIIPEYQPPKDLSVIVAADLIPMPNAVITAFLLDLAVRGYLQIIETRAKSFWRAADYQLKILKPVDNLKAEEQEILSDLFGSLPTPEQRLNLSTLQTDFGFSRRLQDNYKKFQALIRHTYYLREKDTAKSASFYIIASGVLFFGIIIPNLILIIFSFTIFIRGYKLWPLSDTSLAWYRYLEGLRLYIKVAETERIKMLQSPGGVEKTAINLSAEDAPVKLIQLYEKLLPYAVLFRKERAWQKELGYYYKTVNQNPTWYSSSNNNSLNPAGFKGMISSFSQAVSMTSANGGGGGGSSSSGGSGGGGSSGGGGGGGGGWWEVKNILKVKMNENN